jgi:MOSC domain-containing protein YiiM
MRPIVENLSMEELKAGLQEIILSPKDDGVLEMIVRRPAVDQREVLQTGELDLKTGLVGDSWIDRFCKQTPDGFAHPDKQLNLMNSRVIALVATEKERWPLAGDQLFVDLDLSIENLPTGTRLAIGSAVIEVTAMPHKGCSKFVKRFGTDANKFVNSPDNKDYRLRGINAKVVKPGEIKQGDRIRKL